MSRHRQVRIEVSGLKDRADAQESQALHREAGAAWVWGLGSLGFREFRVLVARVLVFGV